MYLDHSVSSVVAYDRGVLLYTSGVNISVLITKSVLSVLVINLDDSYYMDKCSGHHRILPLVRFNSAQLIQRMTTMLLICLWTNHSSLTPRHR